MISAEHIAEIANAKSMRFIARVVAAGRLKSSACGTGHIPAMGPALIVARHYHHLYDGLAMFSAIPRHFHIVVTLDWVQSVAMRLLMTRITRMARWPVVLRREALTHRNDLGASHVFSLSDAAPYQRKALREAVQLLLENRLLVVFPEGYPNIDPVYTPKTRPEQFLPFRRGFVAIARAAEHRLGAPLPIIPAGLRYTLRADLGRLV